ncbi:MAG: leucine-rich repeat domain-containing protein, partial [Ruminococcus sp.]|nr:leucine-rich repeat domain-containing protein [Ruminococcus sp.]
MSFFAEFLKFITENAKNPEIPDKKEISMTNKKSMTKNQAENIGFKVWEARDPNGKACYEILKYYGVETDVTFPEYIDNLPVRIIGTNIFERKNPDTEKWENHWIETVRIPKTVILIKDYAFQDCKTLRNVYFDGNIPEIQPLAFQRCVNLKNPPAFQKRITAPWLNPENFDRKSPPKFETEIINNKFVRIKKIISCREEIVIPEKINGLPVVEVKGGVPEHRDERRRNWGNHTLKKLSFPDSVVKIYKEAFMKCWGLEYLKLPDNKILELGKDSFWNCEKLRLENVMFPKGKDYGDFMGAFNSCDLLKADYYRKKRAEHNKRKDVFVQNGEFSLNRAMREFKNIMINDYAKIRFDYLNFYYNSNIIFNYDENFSFFLFIAQCGRG